MKLSSELAGRTMVVISTQDWNELHTRKQRFALRFAEAGCRVLYIEAQWHWLTYVKQRGRALARLRLAGRPPRQLKPNLWLWTPPPQLPFFQMWQALATVNNRRLAPQLNRALLHIGAEPSPLLYVYTPYNSILIDSLNPGATLYECVDDYAAAKGLIRKRTVERLESSTLQRADACVVTSQRLYEQRQDRVSRLHLIPNAADVDHFAPAQTDTKPEDDLVADILRPRIGFLGAVNYWIDLPLLRYIAERRPGWHLVLVGPVYVSLSGLDKLANVHILGRQPYDRLPAIVGRFDVCLNPYVMDAVATACSPLKLYEYLASGLPVVSVLMPEAEMFSPPIYIGKDYAGIVSQCEAALNESSEQRQARAQHQRDLASRHTWDQRFAATVRVWEELLS